MVRIDCPRKKEARKASVCQPKTRAQMSCSTKELPALLLLLLLLRYEFAWRRRRWCLWWCAFLTLGCCSWSSTVHSCAAAATATVASAWVVVPAPPMLSPPPPQKMQRRIWMTRSRKGWVLLWEQPPQRSQQQQRQQSAERTVSNERCPPQQPQQRRRRPLVTSSQRRREVTAQLLATAAASAFVVPVPPSASASSVSPPPAESSLSASDPSTTSVGPCASGGLAPELPIPGAYQNACMDLSERHIPIAVTTTASGGSVDTKVVWLTVEQRPGQVGAGATGKAVWNSGLLLSRLLQRIAARTTVAVPDGSTTTNWFTGKTVMELGCGAGLGSLTCALLGPDRVYATDGNDGVVPIAARNVEVNRLESIVTTAVLPWGMLPAMDYSEQADLVIGSDLTYSPGSWRALAESMETVLKPDGYVLYLSLGHAGFPVSAEVGGFVTVARDMGLIPVDSSYDPLWPFSFSLKAASASTSGRLLSDFMMQECIVDAREREIVESAGGIRVVLLTHKRNPIFMRRI